MNNRVRNFNRPCWSKSRINNKILCSVCYCYHSFELFSTNYCCSSLTKHTTRQICDTCIYQYIQSKLYLCLTNSIICPELNCHVKFSQFIICDILLKYENNELLNNYLYAQQWQGKSEEWIKRFTLQCPGCNVPIEKNGGCNQMICSQCQLHFYWSRINKYNKINQKSYFIIDPLIGCIIFVLFILLYIYFIRK